MLLNKKSTQDLKKIQSQLYPGENLLWFDKPDVRHLFVNFQTILLFLGGLILTPFTFFAGLFSYVVSPMALFFLLPFFLTGIGLLSYPLLVYKNARRTVYAFTDKRIIVINSKTIDFNDVPETDTVIKTLYNLFKDSTEIIELTFNRVFQKNQSFSKASLKNMFIEKNVYADGSGDLIFFTNTYDQKKKYVKTIHLHLKAIPEVTKAEKIILEIFKS